MAARQAAVAERLRTRRASAQNDSAPPPQEGRLFRETSNSGFETCVPQSHGAELGGLVAALPPWQRRSATGYVDGDYQEERRAKSVPHTSFSWFGSFSSSSSIPTLSFCTFFSAQVPVAFAGTRSWRRSSTDSTDMIFEHSQLHNEPLKRSNVTAPRPAPAGPYLGTISTTQYVDHHLWATATPRRTREGLRTPCSCTSVRRTSRRTRRCFNSRVLRNVGTRPLCPRLPAASPSWRCRGCALWGG